MALPDPAYRRYRDAYLRGDVDTVLGEGDALAARLADEPWSRHLSPAVILMQGATMADRPDRAVPAEAIRYLEQGLALHRRVHDGLVPTDEARALDLEVGPVAPFQIQLVQALLVVGRYAEVRTLAQALEEPGNRADHRLAGLRAHAAVSALQGAYEIAHQLLNAAASLTERMRSRFATMLVDVDRTVLLGTQGRLREGIGLFDNLAKQLGRTTPGTSGAWAGAVAAAGSLTLSRFAAEAGDPVTAERLLGPGAVAVEHLDDPYWRAQLDLTISTLLWSQSRFDDAVVLCREARSGFEAGGYTPGAAQAIMHEGRLAWSQGFASVATPLLELARQQLHELGHHRETSQIDQALEHVA